MEKFTFDKIGKEEFRKKISFDIDDTSVFQGALQICRYFLFDTKLCNLKQINNHFVYKGTLIKFSKDMLILSYGGDNYAYRVY